MSAIKEKIETYKNTLENTSDPEMRNTLQYHIDSMETEVRITTNYDPIIDKVISLVDNLNVENKLGTSNKLIRFISVLKELDNDDGRNFIKELQQTFKDIPTKDSEEILSHAYSYFFLNRLRSL